MLYQLHHQFKDGHTEMVMQFELTKKYKLINAVNEGNEKHPLPQGAIWLCCNEYSDEFVKTA